MVIRAQTLFGGLQEVGCGDDRDVPVGGAVPPGRVRSGDPAVGARGRCGRCVADLRRMARRRLPRGVFDCIDGGAEDEVTLPRNSSSLKRLEFDPPVLRDVGAIDTGERVCEFPAVSRDQRWVAPRSGEAAIDCE